MVEKTVATKDRIGRVGQRRQVVIPREFSEQSNGTPIKPKRVVNPDDVLTAEEAKAVRKGIKQIKEGRFKLWSDVKHELGR